MNIDCRQPNFAIVFTGYCPLSDVTPSLQTVPPPPVHTVYMYKHVCTGIPPIPLSLTWPLCRGGGGGASPRRILNLNWPQCLWVSLCAHLPNTHWKEREKSTLGKCKVFFRWYKWLKIDIMHFYKMSVEKDRHWQVHFDVYCSQVKLPTAQNKAVTISGKQLKGADLPPDMFKYKWSRRQDTICRHNVVWLAYIAQVAPARLGEGLGGGASLPPTYKATHPSSPTHVN